MKSDKPSDKPSAIDQSLDIYVEMSDNANKFKGIRYIDYNINAKLASFRFG